MVERDILVGIITVGLGISMIAGSCGGWKWYQQFWMYRLIHARYGHRWAQIVNVFLGLVFVLLGTVVIMGWFNHLRQSLVNRSGTQHRLLIVPESRLLPEPGTWIGSICR